jgi:nucleoside phosphorylase
MKYEVTIVFSMIFVACLLWFCATRYVRNKTVNTLNNIEGFSTEQWFVYFDTGIAFDYSQQLVAVALHQNIYVYHISKIYRWELQCDPVFDEHRNKVGNDNFRIWLRIRDINCPALTVKLSSETHLHMVDEALMNMQEYGQKLIIQNSSLPTAVILTAIGPEVRAILSHLEQYEEENVKGTIFFMGVFGGNFNPWRVAIAEIGAGNVMASSISERAFEYFNPQVALFVGVAGGLKDVRLGDVVAATKVYAYESGKETDGNFKPRPDLNWSSYAMEQRAKATRTRGTWTKRLKLQHDKEPVAYIGPIAAGEKVVGATRSETAKIICQTYSDALAVEMEGRGFVNALHTNEGVNGIVIRGISDLLDKKSESDAGGWQEIAADSAAAFAFELLATCRP